MDDPRSLTRADTPGKRLAWLVGYWLFGLALRWPVMAINRHLAPSPTRELAQLALKTALSVLLPALAIRWLVPSASLPESLGLCARGGERRRPRLAVVIAILWIAFIYGASKLLGQASTSIIPASIASGLFMTAHVTVEEIAFRGVILGWLAADRPFFSANVITALMFLSMHVPGWLAAGMRVEIVPMSLILVALALVLGWVKRLTGNIWLATLLHLANNALSGW
ncbi:MAG TPA: CPBP family intramembrane glutamic endopeptidase [Polyangia bacterium]|nr:CPBP family intramembrane glutamic endopeptidase [Polyangia bacterium]